MTAERDGANGERDGADAVRTTRVVIVGAGFGGIGTGVGLKRAGIEDFLILEEGTDVGGVWRDNTYPGCSCDVPAHLYSFSFAPYRSTRRRYPGQQHILAYLRRVAADHGLVPHLRLRTPVAAATYREDRARWEVRTVAGEVIDAEFVVFAVGQLHRPWEPALPGREVFAGNAFHTARWDHRVDPAGREIAVIGTGSSAAQVVPELAAVARRVTVYQRTPNWLLPKPCEQFGRVSRTLLHLPAAHRMYRGVLAQGADLTLAPIMRRGWSARPAQWLARAHLRHRVADPDLRAKLTPRHPIGAKRILFDNGYYRALTRDNVELVTEPIARLTPDGVCTIDGVHRRADVLVYATGFRAAEFLAPIVVRGRGGQVLHERWRDGAEAYLGLAVPGFPNAFLIAGPNTFNPAGSNPGMKEHQIEFVLECLRWRDEIGAPAIEVTPAAMEGYRRWLSGAIAETVWPASASWYRHPSGRVTNPWPATARSFARMLKQSPAHAFRRVDPPPAPPRRPSACDRARVARILSARYSSHAPAPRA
ncbi:NAD(P)/FAD-dependent oxidoreductase [Nocardia farcinica]|uniref:flavin-containing monooxygenase n=1 Tax=Nocardia farcinica TaxID=37329 RepID=UPI001892D338|nr:NAD(P)/FAD-dependent oxidoreductase [Nocardia farcinica]MBF6261252.1 NAD(P)/FAD-dependent oxidoreductase [Nocardia farcinica]MBF6279080.1 NAD(P)/FAD-dependent oxidoreductase [Nocardia farcinica]MBF6304262.1 NAD(P)/FAD-dependent oxidoreductase [Nocardia farcinica]MBF6490789.1 NAD(P)/FAD-dependent oxidoreductase [Nocardia farcinica]MBF6507099.1 NAD(P)/FAD-dependent oxidoreductase [Nocardia farcinica]